ncbi:hypothetical protein [Spirosoma oryzicola]|uniref:hypothetical protein n=1 Tax=Spirosoma oryzicola TaxID=2898794 RepID=UPI001E5E847E|nr:hypothetical protein [Spirosoma oryzicola]UHG93329.1 hypothetical protein LQ777_10595 [Spirosoma oryzicola]
MAFNNNEKVTITLDIQGDQARNQLNLLEVEAKQLERALKEAPKGTKEWADLYKEIGRNADAQKALRQEIGTSALTLNQLEKEAKSIVKEMKDMTAGTDEYAAKSARLREVNGRITELRADYKALIPEIIKVTASVADWDDENKRSALTVKQLREVAAALGDEIEQLVPGTKEHTAAVEKQDAVNKQLNTTAKQVIATIGDWDDENKRATLTVKQLQVISKQLGDEIEQLVPGTKEHAAAVEKQDAVNKQLNTTLEQQPGRWKRIQDTVVGLVGAFSLMRVVEEVFSFFKQGITDALKLSDAMGGVEKATGQSSEQVKALAGELDKIDTRTTKEDLMTIAQIGGQLGVANDELLGFVKSVDMAVVALGDEFSGGAEEAAKEIGALQKLFKETKDMKAGDAINDIGSALNELGAAGSATAPVVADFTQRMGQLGDLSPQITQTMGLGAAFQELGLSAEISAGGLSNILLGAAKATALFADQLHISEAEMKELINTNPNEFLLKLAESLKGLPADLVAKRLDDLGIKSQEATKVMSLLKDQTDMVRQKQEIAANAMKGIYNAALEQVGKSTDTFAKKLGLSKDELEKLIKSNPNEFFIRLANSFKGLSDAQIAEEMKKLGFYSAEATKLVTDLSKATNKQTQEQLLANPALKQATSLQNEFNKMNSTAAAEVDKAKKSMMALAVDAGGVLLPMLTKSVTGFVSFVDIIRAVPAFLSENKESFIALGVALVTFNAQTILAEANTLRLAAAEKIATVSKEASAVAQRLLNTAMSMNPMAAVITVVALLAAGFMALYNNSVTVRAGVNGLFEAMKVATVELGRMWEALKGLNFAEAATIMFEGGKKVAAGFSKGYSDTMAAEHPKQLESHKKLVDDKKTASVQGAAQTGQLEVLEDQKTLAQKAEQAQKAREKLAEDTRKDTEEAYKKRREAQIEAIKDETERERAKLQWKHEQEVAAIQASKASEVDKNLAIKALDAQLKAELDEVNLKHVEKIRADQQKALDMMRDYQLSLETDEKRRKELDALFKYEKEKARIDKEIADETQKAQLLKALDQTYKNDLSRIATEFRNKEIEANKAMRSAEQAAEMAQYDLKELQAGTNATKLLSIKKQRLDKEYEFLRENMRQERDDELRRIEESNMSQEHKTQTQKAINDKYLADVKSSVIQHTNDVTAIDTEAVNQKRQRYEAFSSAFKGLLQGDFQAFAEQSANIVAGEKAAWQTRMSENMAKYEMVANIATESVNFLTKMTQERLDKEIAASKKETEQKLADSEKRLDDAIKAAEEQAEKEKEAAGDSADAIKEIEEKLAESKSDIRTEFEKEADAIRKDGAAKEKDLAKQKWEADKRAQVATAIISGAQAALKALASGIFPVNLVFAGIIAGLTAIQVAKIKNQPAPAFRDGGMGQIGSDGGSYSDYAGQMFGKGGQSYFRNAGIMRGSRHGSQYGERGIAMIDRQSGREVGEAEDGEPFMILSRNTYANNKGVVDRLLYSSLYRGGEKIAYAQGGVGGSSWKGIGTIAETPYYEKRMMLFGSKKAKREAEEAARQAEEEARKAEAEAQAAIDASVSAYDGPTSGDAGDANGTGEAAAATGAAEEQAKKAAQMAQDQLDLLADIGEAIETADKNNVDAMAALAKLIDLALSTLTDKMETALINLDKNTQANLQTQTLTIALNLRSLNTSLNAKMDKLSVDVLVALDELTNRLEASLDQVATTTKQELGNLAVTNKSALDGMAYQVGNLKGSINAVEGAVRGVEGATRGVEGAVYGTNQAGRLDQLYSAISQLK